MLVQEANKSWLERLTYGPPLSPAELEVMAKELDELDGIKEVMRNYHCDDAEELEAYLEEQSVLSFTTGQFDEVCAERDDYEREAQELKDEVERLEGLTQPQLIEEAACKS